VKSKGQEDVGATEPVVCSTKLELGHREGVAQVQQAVLVRVRKVAKELLARPWRSSARIGLKNFALIPTLLNLGFVARRKSVRARLLGSSRFDDIFLENKQKDSFN
jgi:hypothetical protein